MNVTGYDEALRALNEAVRMKGHDYVDKFAKEGLTCQNIIGSKVEGYLPSCIVGTALVWLGVPAEWFAEVGCYSTSIEPLSERLAGAEILHLSRAAVALMSRAQTAQDSKETWGDAVVRAHLHDTFDDLVPR